MQLTEFFPRSAVLRDAAVQLAFGLSDPPPGAVCYALTAEAIQGTNAYSNFSAIITLPGLANRVAEEKGCVASEQPRADFYRFHNELCRLGVSQLHSEEIVASSASLAPTAAIGRYVRIGERVRVGAHAVIEDFTIIGDDTIIGPHAVIGGRGLQDTQVDGRNVIVEFAGGVRIGERCEILSGALIQRPYLCAYTEIADDTKLGPGASVGHGCRIGRGSYIGAGAVVSGNVSVGHGVWIGPSAVISDGRKIGDRGRVQLGSVVVKDVDADGCVSGNFALSHVQHLLLHTRARHAT